jgi:CRP-like cAMP-binding protein
MAECLGRIRNYLLAALLPADFAVLAPNLTTVHLKRDTVLLRTGSKIDYVYFPHGGMISLMFEMSNGETAATAVLGCEDAVGMLSALGPAHSPVTAVVRVATTASQLPASRFHIAFRQSAAIRHMVQTHAMALLAQLQQVAACNALHPVDARLARWLLYIRDGIDSNTIPLTHETLAQLLGVRRTTVTLALNKLRKLGAVRLNRRGQIEIERANLENITCECYEAMRHVVDRDILKAAAPPIQAMLAHDILAEGTLPIARGEIRKRRD